MTAARILPALCALWLLFAPAATAGPEGSAPPIPERPAEPGRVRLQRIRFQNASLLEQAHRSVALGKDDEAASLFLQALENDPENDHIKVYLVRTYSRLDKWRAGIDLCDELIARYPDYYDPYFHKAYFSIAMSRPGIAAATLRTLLSLIPDDFARLAEIHRNLAELDFQAGHCDAASDHAEKWLAAEEDTAALRLLAECAVRQERWDKAVVYLDRELAIEQEGKRRAIILVKRGSALFNMGDFEGAEVSLLEAKDTLKETGYHAQIARLLGRIAMKGGRYEEAAAYFRESLSPPETEVPTEILKHLAWIYVQLGRCEEASEFGARWLEAEETPEALRLLAECSLDRERWKEALGYLDRELAMEDTPGRRGAVHLNRGLALYQLRQYGKAREALNKARGLLRGTDHLPFILMQLGHISMKEGRYQKAAGYFRESLSASRFEEAAASAYLDALMKLHQWEEGADAARRFLERGDLSEPFRLAVLEKLLFCEKSLDRDVETLETGKALLATDPRERYILEVAVAASRLDRREEAIRYYRAYLDRTFEARVALDLFYLLKQEGRAAEGEPLLRRILAAEHVGPSVTHSAWYESAQLYLASHQSREYLEAMKKVLESSPEPEYFYEYGVQLQAAGREEEARRSLIRSLEGGEHFTNFETCKILANLHLKRGEYGQAREWLVKALTFASPGPDWKVARARVDFGTGKFALVVDRLMDLPRQNDSTHLLLGFSLYRMNMPGLALFHLNRVSQPESLSEKEQISFHENRAYLNFDQGLYGEALSDIERTLELRPSDELALIRVKTLARMGKCDQAKRAGLDLWDGLRHREDAGPLAAGALEVVGSCEYALGAHEDAAASFTLALEQDPSLAHLTYSRGLAFAKAGELEKARADFLALLESGTSVPIPFWGDYGITAGRLGHYREGSAALEKALAYYPYDLRSLEELGYQQMRSKNFVRSRAAFAGAIDLYTVVIPRLEEEEAEAYEGRLYAARREFSKLDKTWGGQLYLARAELDDDFLPSSASATGSAFRSQAGAALTYRPPRIGFRNEKTLDLFGRILGNFEEGSWSLDSDSFQGGLGLSYKPFSKYSFSVSVERLFKIGDEAENNWLWRNLLSFEWGEKQRKGQLAWLSGKLYGELSFYLADPARVVYYLDGQLGLSWGLGRKYILTLPRVLAVRRYEENDVIGTYGLIGVGAKLRIWEGEKKYTTERWYLDLFGHYTRGEFDEQPADIDRKSFDGWMFGITFYK